MQAPQVLSEASSQMAGRFDFGILETRRGCLWGYDMGTAKGPKPCFWLSKRSQNGSKLRARSLPAAKRLQGGSGGPPGPQKVKKKKTLFWSRFGTKTRPKNEVCPERPFGQHSAPNGLRNGAKMAPKQGPKRTHAKYGKLCSRLDGSSLLASQEGSKKSYFLESLFGPLWRPLLGDALENSWLQGDPKRDPKGGPK